MSFFYNVLSKVDTVFERQVAIEIIYDNIAELQQSLEQVITDLS